jgi:hypothetical protein
MLSSIARRECSARAAASEALMATLAERERGAVADPEGPWACQDDRGDHIICQRVARPGVGTPSPAVCGPLHGQDEQDEIAQGTPNRTTRGYLVRVVQQFAAAT